MRVFQSEQVAQLDERALTERLKPFLSDGFDPISLQRPGFLSEIGLEPEDEAWLRGGGTVWTWLSDPVFLRALAEEAVARQATPDVYLQNSAAWSGEQLWRAAESVMQRGEQILRHPAAAAELGLKPADLQERSRRWSAEDGALLDGVMLLLRGLVLPPAELARRLALAVEKKTLGIFTSRRAPLTHLDPDQVQPTVALRGHAVGVDFAREMEENAELNPELWGRQWVDFLSRRKHVSQGEFVTLLEHLEEKERYRWKELVAVGGARARRAVAAIALLALERLPSAEDTASLERLWKLIDDFSERYELQQLLKTRFGLKA